MSISIWPVLTWSVLTWSVSSWPVATWPVPNWPVQTRRVPSWPVPTWLFLTWPVKDFPVLTRLVLSVVARLACWRRARFQSKLKLEVGPKCGKIIYKALRCKQKSKHQRLASESCILAWTPYYLCSKYFACFQLTLAYFIVKTSTQPQLNST